MSDMNVSFLIRFLSEGAQTVRRDMGGILDGARDMKAGLSGALRDGLSASNIDAALANSERSLTRARGRLLDAAGMAAALAAPIRQAALFEEAFADLEKVLDASAERLNALRGSLLAMSREIALSATGLTAIMAAAAQGGIPTGQLERFTAFTARAAVAFDMAAGEIGDRFAKLRNVYKLNQDALESFADAANHLSNNMAARASEITEFANRAAGAQRTLKLSAVEMEAFGAAMIAAGIVPETAARGVAGLAARLETGSKSIRGALEAIGTDYDAFRARLAEDAPAAILELFETLSARPEGMKALVELVGQDFSDDFSKLLNNPGLLAQAFALVGDETAFAGSALAEYNKRAATTVGQLRLFKNQAAAIAISLGTTLLPAVNDTLSRVGALTAGFSDFAAAHPGLASGLVKAAAGLIAFGVASRAVGYGIALIRGPLIRLVSLFLRFDKAGRNVSVVARLLRGMGPAAGAASTAVAGLIRRIGGIGNALRIATAATWVIPLGFEILDDLGRTPEQRLEELQKNWERWRKLENDVAASSFGNAWQSVKDRVNELFGLEKGEVPADALGRWLADLGRSAAEAARDLGISVMENVLSGFQTGWEAVVAWLRDSIAALQGLFDFAISFDWPDPPAWLSRMVDRIGLGGAAAAPAGPAPAPAVSPWPGDGGSDPIAELRELTRTFGKGGGPLKEKVEATIRSEVIDKRPPNVTVNAPITINGVADPKAAAKAAASELTREISRAKTGALHGGTE